MARWATTPSEIRQIATVSEMLKDFQMIIRVHPLGGFRPIDGVLRSMNMGNNGGQTVGSWDRRGPWHYYGEVTIETITAQTMTIDFLDIASIQNIWDESVDDFERAGIIQVVDWPNA